MRVWDDTDKCFYEIEALWNGTLARQDHERYSLLGDGWMQREAVLGQHNWNLEKGTYITQKEARNAKAADPFVLNPATAGPTFVGPCAGGCGQQVIGERKCASCRRKSGSHAASNGRPRRECACGRKASKGCVRCSSCIATNRQLRKPKETAA